MTGLLLLRAGRFYHFPSVYLEHWAPSNTKPREHEFQNTWDPGYPGSGTTGFYQYPSFRQHTSPSSSFWTERSCNTSGKLYKNRNKLQLQLNRDTAKNAFCEEHCWAGGWLPVSPAGKEGTSVEGVPLKGQLHATSSPPGIAQARCPHPACAGPWKRS